MVVQNFRCPVCGETAAYSGIPGEHLIVSCSLCGSKGRVTLPSGEIAIEVNHLTKTYGDLVAVNDVSFSVKKGEIFAFLGPNGAGKTTTVEIIESIRTLESGSVKILGKDILTDFDGVKRNIGVLPQEFHSFERLTVRETLEYFSRLYEKRADIDKIMESMDIKFIEKRLYKNLSGGLKQRVGVAIALVNDPDVVFLDEPTTGLDPKSRREVWNVIANLRSQGKTVFLTTHYMEEAEYLADHIAILHKGRIIAEGSLEELISKHGDGSILRIKNCSSKDVVNILKNKGFEAFTEGDGDVAVKIAQKERVLEVLSILENKNVEYSGVDIRRSNLEEIFLKLTGARLREGS